VIKDLEQQAREILMVLQNIHQNPAQPEGRFKFYLLWKIFEYWKNTFLNKKIFHVTKAYFFIISVLICCEKARGFFGSVREKYAELASIIPPNQFYHYHDLWRFVNQRLTFLIALTLFLETGKLATVEQVAEILGCKFWNLDYEI